MDQCEHHDSCIGGIDKKLDRILERLGKGDTSLATLALRMKLLEGVVYGGVALILVAKWKGVFG